VTEPLEEQNVEARPGQQPGVRDAVADVAAVAVTWKDVAARPRCARPPSMQALAVGCLEHPLFDRVIRDRARVGDGSGGKEE
jgi:hypothetical protein